MKLLILEKGYRKHIVITADITFTEDVFKSGFDSVIEVNEDGSTKEFTESLALTGEMVKVTNDLLRMFGIVVAPQTQPATTENP